MTARKHEAGSTMQLASSGRLVTSSRTSTAAADIITRSILDHACYWLPTREEESAEISLERSIKPRDSSALCFARSGRS